MPRVLVDALDQGVFVLDTQGRCLDVNRRLAQWLGRPPVDLIGQPVEKLFPAHSDRYRAAMARVLQGERNEMQSLNLLGEEVRIWRVLQLPVRDEDGQVVGLVGLCRDLTDDRRRDDELRQARQLTALDQGALGLTHDLRNLLTVIRGHLDMLSLAASEEAERELGPVINATDRAMELSKRFLSTARQKALPGESLDLNSVLTEVASLLRPRLEPCIHLDVRGRAPLPRVAGDICQLSRMLLNLCLNSLAAMTSGGRLRLETEAVRVGPDDLDAHPQARPGLFVCLTIHDNGPGMPLRMQSRLCELFARGHRDGAGDGLNVVTSIVASHEGWLKCDSASSGTCFRVYLPAISPGKETPARGTRR
jgi:PAS domain S-box-containing protein